MPAIEFVVGLIVVVLLTAYAGLHTISEGHVGVYYRGGRLLDRVSEPGWHVQVPFVDAVSEVQITMQTDAVREIPCGTSGGVLIYFDTIEVVNRLKVENVHNTVKQYGVNYDKMWIFDKIHHEINQFCSKHTLREVFIDQFDTLDENLMNALQNDCDRYKTGIDIITVRVTKPRIPDSVRLSYEKIESEKAALFLATERQKVVEKDAETEAKRRRIAAENEKAVRQIQIEKEIAEREGSKKMKVIEGEILLAHEKATADAALYSARAEAEANNIRLTPKFLQYQAILAIGNISKVYFGESIPQMMIHEGNALQRMLNQIETSQKKD